ncbi:MAG: hypothetical protein WD357_11355 [Gracilimonas sp.]
MIKEVFNSITNASNTGKTSLSGSLKEGEDANSNPGFFGKMLMALQTEGEENTQPKSSNSEGKETEGSISGLTTEAETENESTPLEDIQSKKEIEVDDSSDQSASLNENKEISAETKESETTKIQSSENKSEVIDPQNLERSGVENSGADRDTVQGAASQQAKEAQTESSDSQTKTVLNTASDLKLPEGEKALQGEESSKINKAPLNSDSTPKQTGSENGRVSENPIVGNTSESSVSGNQSGGVTEGSESSTFQQKTNITAAETEKGVQVAKGSEKVSTEADLKTALKTEGTEGSVTDSGKETKTEGQRKFFDLRAAGKAVGVQTSGVSEKAVNARQPVETGNTKAVLEQTLQNISKDVELKEQPQLQVELANAQKSNEERGKRYDLFNQTTEGNNGSSERLALATNSGGNQQGMPFNSQPGWIKFQADTQQAAEMTANQQVFFNEQFMEAAEVTENTSNEQAAMNMNRLAELPINNVFLKRSVIPGLTGAFQKATSAGKDMPQNWQKHSFDLDDGNKIELSTRNVDGVIQVKIASSSIELSKMMQQYGEEIKNHLEQECELSVDLQFDDNQGDAMEGFFGDSPSSGNKGESGNSSGEGPEKILNKRAEEHLQQTVRKFGYNQMEWTI